MFDWFEWEKLINIFNVSAFLIGIFLGLFIAGFVYAILVIGAIKKSEKIILRKPKNTDQAECLKFVRQARHDYRKRKRRKSMSERFTLAKDLAERISYEIARFHFPDSKQPFLEISTYEALESIKYICSRIEQILERKPLNQLKDLSGIQVLAMFEFKEKMEENKTLKLAKIANDSTLLKAAKSAISLLSPAYLVRRTVVNSTINLSIDTLCLVFINIVGEEVYKLYSKQLFEDNEIEELLVEGLDIDVQEKRKEA
ncbi:hypothetical protein RI065_02330 [Mycoplasmatota bacterium zrk1]